MRKAIGFLLIIVAVIAFIVNFNLYHFWVFENLSGLINMLPSWLFNPLSLLTSGIVGNVWLISASLANVLNSVWAVIYSIALVVIGIQLAK